MATVEECFAEDTWKGEISPIFIPSVVQIVLSHLPYKDLLEARLVCRQWAEEATKLLEKRTKIALRPFDNVTDLNNAIKEEKQPSPSKPASSFKISVVSWNKFSVKIYDEIDGGKRIDSFFALVGNKITYAEVSMRIAGEPTIWKIFQKHSSNLETIELTDTIECSREGQISRSSRFHSAMEMITLLNQGQFFLKKEVLLPSVTELRLLVTENSYGFNQTGALLLIMFLLPNLEKLFMRNPAASYEMFPHWMMLFSSCPEFQNPNKKLARFDFPLILNEGEIAVIEEKYKYPLESLQMVLHPGLRFPGLYSWISSLGPTLTSLDLDFSQVPPNPETFPCGNNLINLKTLKLNKYYGPLDFVENMQTLESVKLTNVNLSVAFRDLPNNSGCPNMRSLEIYSGHSSAGRMSFDYIYKSISQYFPRLKKLRVDFLSNSNLKVIITGCPFLEELLLVDSVVSDHRLTGMAVTTCDELMMRLEFADLEGELPSVDEKSFIEPRLADLKHLRKLHIKSCSISNVSLLFGLTHCSRLTDLCITSSMITAPALKHLIKKIQLKCLRFSPKLCYRINQVEAQSISETACKNYKVNVIITGDCAYCGVKESLT